MSTEGTEGRGHGPREAGNPAFTTCSSQRVMEAVISPGELLQQPLPGTEECSKDPQVFPQMYLRFPHGDLAPW